jgi:histone acetyltransferase (RNA polymerase elongator complex component)
MPYAEKNIRDLIDVLKYYKKNIQPWVRIQRLVRDIPSTSIEAGYEKITNLRQIIQDELKTENIKCHCIRCMEIGNDNSLIENAKIVVRKYEASEGDEYFISIESNKKSKFYELDYWKYVLFLIKHYFMLCLFHKEPYWEGNLNTYNGIIGFCRLRIDPNIRSDMFKELTRCALIREVHVYGYSSSIGNTNKNILKSCQHKGFGQKLVLVAEEIALQNGYKKMAIIAGVGTREYYKNKCGYHLEGTYMIRHLTSSMPDYKLTIGLIAWVIILIDILFI